jgi:HEAT repeat protein
MSRIRALVRVAATCFGILIIAHTGYARQSEASSDNGAKPSTTPPAQTSIDAAPKDKPTNGAAREARYRGLTMTWWLQRLKDESIDAKLKLEAIRALRTIGPRAAEAIPDLISSMEDSDFEVRVAAIDALGTVGKGSDLAAAALLDTLDDSDTWYRMNAMRAMRGVGVVNSAIVAGLCTQLAEKDGAVYFCEGTNRQCAVNTLKALGADAVRPALPTLMKVIQEEGDSTEDPNWGGEVVEAIAVAGKDGVPSLMTIMTSASKKYGWDDTVRDAGIVLQKLGGEAVEAVPKLLEILVDEESYQQDHAAAILAAIGKASPSAAQKIVPVMLAELSTSSLQRRARAADALGEMAPHAGQAVAPLGQIIAEFKSDEKVAEWVKQVTGYTVGEYESNGHTVASFRELYRNRFETALDSIRAAQSSMNSKR